MNESTTTFVCTKDDPWTPAEGVPVAHPRAYVVKFETRGNQAIPVYECPWCKERFIKGENHR